MKYHHTKTGEKWGLARIPLRKIFTYAISALLVLILTIICFLVYLRFFARSNFDNKTKQNGDVVISKIEDYRNKNGKLPRSLSEIGLPDTESGRGPFYSQTSTTTYEIYYAFSLDAGLVYHSDTKEWVDEE